MAAVLENARFVWRLRPVFLKNVVFGNVFRRLASANLHLTKRFIGRRIHLLWTYMKRPHCGNVSSPLLALGWWGASTPADTPPAKGPSQEELILQEADQLFDSNETEELYSFLVKHKDTGNAEILWRLARAARVLAEKSKDAERKKQLTYESLGYAEQALKLDDKNFACHKWYAITLSNVGDFEGINVKIKNSYILKEHFEKAIELNPVDPTCRHLLGLWCFTFADMPWYQRKIAAAVFGTPPTSTYDEAMNHFQMAEKLEPNFFSKNHMMLGKTFLRQNRKEDAKVWLTKVVNGPCKTVDDEQAKKEAEELLKKHF